MLAGTASGCFLCAPPAHLTYWQNHQGSAISGLGPIVPGYSVVGAVPHVRSAADAAAGGAPEFLTFAEQVRLRLVRQYGSCLMTEHGRMPVCVETVAAERHCYHAHFLLFPGAPGVLDAAAAYFEQSRCASTLLEALRAAHSFGEYFLLSPDPATFVVFGNQKTLPRQFARVLVAASVGKIDEASWQRFPKEEEAAATAAHLRNMFGGEA